MRTAILTSGRDALELKGGLRDVDAGSDEEERELSVESCGIDTPAEVHGTELVYGWYTLPNAKDGKQFGYDDHSNLIRIQETPTLIPSLEKIIHRLKCEPRPRVRDRVWGWWVGDKNQYGGRSF
ncbi:hypothetical protein VUR80DRAFT_4962 [Thermomyces stellatus]